MLGHLWHATGTFEIGEVLTRSLQSATRAVGKMGAGNAVDSTDAFRPADVLVVATPDKEIAGAAQALYEANVVSPGTTIIHLSGALAARQLAPGDTLDSESIYYASCHPARSFADFDTAVQEFEGTWCAVEGDSFATNVMERAFQAIGANTFFIGSDNKLAYHAASVMASNYLNTLVASAVDCYGLAGVNPELALKIIEPMLTDTANNIFRSDPYRALTGPIRRGDSEVVERELQNLEQLAPALADLYRVLGVATVGLVARNTTLDSADLARLLDALRDDADPQGKTAA